MKLTIAVDDAKWAWAVQACAADQSDPADKALQMVNEYLDACGRQLGLDDETRVTKAIADPAKLAVAKGALGL